MRLAAAAAALLVLLGATPAGAGEELAIDDLSLDAYPEVTIDVTVPPDMASLDLLPGDFEVFVAGRRRSAAVWSLASRPTAVILVIDTSGSMDGAPMEGAVAAATAFLERLPETADVAVVSFGDTPTVTAEPGTSPSDAAAALSTLSAGGETSLYDAVLAAVRLYPVDAETRRILIVLSDGGDTVSSAPLATAVRGVELSNAELHMISLDSPEADIAPLETLATAGGTGVSSADTSGLSSVFESIGDTVLGRYRIVFATDATGPTEIAIQVRHQSFSASATTRAMFPVAPAVSAALPAPATTIAGSDPPVTGVPDAAGAEAHPQPSLIGSSWTLPAGVATVIGGVLALVLLTSRDGSRARASVADIAPPKRRRFKEVLASLSHGAETAADEVLRRRGSSAGIEAALDRAGLSIKPTQYAVAAVVSVIALGVAGSVLIGPLGAIALGLMGLALPRMVLRLLASRRRRSFSDQLEGTLQMIGGSLRAGYGLLQAITTVGEEAPDPTGTEFERVVAEHRLGRPLTDSLAGLSDRMGDQDLQWVVDAVDIQQEVGGDLAEVLDTVSETIRDRNKVRRQIRALSAEGRMSATILIALPFAIAALIAVITPEYLTELTSTTMGRVMLGVAVIQMGLGAAWIRKIVRVVF